MIEIEYSIYHFVLLKVRFVFNDIKFFPSLILFYGIKSLKLFSSFLKLKFYYCYKLLWQKIALLVHRQRYLNILHLFKLMYFLPQAYSHFFCVVIFLLKFLYIWRQFSIHFFLLLIFKLWTDIFLLKPINFRALLIIF